MAVNIQTGDTSFAGATQSVTVSTYDATKTWLRYSMRCDGVDNAFDDQVVARKVSSTSISFERVGNTGTVFIRWWLIESDDFSVQDVDDVGPLASGGNTFEDYTITGVDLARSFVDVSVAQDGNRNGDTHFRARFTSSTNVRVEAGAAVDAVAEWFIQAVEIAPGAFPSVQEVLFSGSTGNEDQAITAVDPDNSYIVATAYFASGAGDWDNNELHSVRLNAAGTEVEMRRTQQGLDPIAVAVYVVSARICSVQQATVSVTGTSNTGSFTAPSDTSLTFVLGGAYYNESQFAVDQGGPDDSGHTLVPNAGFTSVTAQRETSLGTATVEIMMVEVLGAPQDNPVFFGGTLF